MARKGLCYSLVAGSHQSESQAAEMFAALLCIRDFENSTSSSAMEQVFRKHFYSLSSSVICRQMARADAAIGSFAERFKFGQHGLRLLRYNFNL